jgi:NitT/TauT family transport system ATP-binding protein
MCDRILVFSSNPGRVSAEIKVDLPQPRDRLDPIFRALVDDIYARMTVRVPAVPVNDGLFPGTGIAMVLPRVSTNALAGMIEEVDGSPFGGRAAMADLADQLQLEIDDLFPMAETLQLLRFAELQGAEIRLTLAARRYAQADVDARKAQFAQALLAYVPLAQHIRRILDERAGHTAPARRFRDELEDHMSEDCADETLRTVTNWGRYAEVFAYDEGSDRFSLEDAV